MPMTQHYLCGELATRLALLERAAADQTDSCAVHELRRDAEMAPPSRLCDIALRALQLADTLCWDALDQGRVRTFAEEAVLAAELHEFAVCAHLLDDE